MFTKAKYEVSDVLDPEDGFVPGYSRHTSLRSIPDCGDPGCWGECDHCKEYEAYCKRRTVAERHCKKLQSEDPECVVCMCQLCTMDVSPNQEEE